MKMKDFSFCPIKKEKGKLLQLFVIMQLQLSTKIILLKSFNSHGHKNTNLIIHLLKKHRSPCNNLFF